MFVILSFIIEKCFCDFPRAPASASSRFPEFLLSEDYFFAAAGQNRSGPEQAAELSFFPKAERDVLRHFRVPSSFPATSFCSTTVLRGREKNRLSTQFCRNTFVPRQLEI
jgi:hypothetical protein